MQVAGERINFWEWKYDKNDAIFINGNDTLI